MTLIELIEHHAQQLTTAQVSLGHGTTDFFDEAAWLTLWKLGLPLGEVPEIAVSAQQASDVAMLFKERIATRKPAAYLTREAWLQGVSFYVDERVIVPRSLIAELLVQADTASDIDPWLHPDATRVLDLCTGNGSLAVLAAMSFPDVQVDAADLSCDALAVAEINVQRHDLGARIRLIESDGCAALLAEGSHDTFGPYDLILCNPPYVNAASMAALPAEYQAEPTLALAGGTDGMDFVRGLLRDAPALMRADAVLILEIGNERAHFDAAFGHLDAVWLDTSAGCDQVLLLTREALTATTLNLESFQPYP
jgi:ribosomal protein L3 glutamine methyltransferase